MKKYMMFISILVGLQGAVVFGMEIPINAVPFEISNEGSYVLASDLTLAAGETDPAITIKETLVGTGVTIDFNGHTLRLDNSMNPQTGILIEAGLNVTIKNLGDDIDGKGTILALANQNLSTGIMTSTASSNNIAFNNLTIQDIAFQNVWFGVTDTGDQNAQEKALNRNLTIERCTFALVKNGISQGITFGMLNKTGGETIIRRCMFSNGNIGINLYNNACNTTMYENSFTNFGCGISIQSVDDPANGFYYVKQAENNVIGIEIDTITETFTNVDRAITILGAKNTTIRGTTVTTSMTSKAAIVAATPTKNGTALLPEGRKGEGLTLTNVRCIAGAQSQAAHVVLGGLEPNSHFHDVQVNGGSYTNEKSCQLFWDIVAPQVSKLGVKLTQHTASAVARDMADCPLVTAKGCPLVSSHIQLGLPLQGVFPKKPLVSDVTIERSEMQGGMQAGIRSDTGCFPVKNCNITVDEVCIIALERGIEFVNTKKALVQRSTIEGVTGTPDMCCPENTGVGIYLRKCTPCNKHAATTDVMITRNDINENGVGVVVDCGLLCNKIIDNNLKNNLSCPIFADENTIQMDNRIMGPLGPCEVCETICEVPKNAPIECTVIDLDMFLGDLSTPKLL